MTGSCPVVDPADEHWPSGVGGAQCSECYQFTIVRPFPYAFDDDPLDEDTQWLCLPCWRGEDDEF